MTPAEGIAKLGFRRWYERELIEGHVYFVTCFLSLILMAACLEQLDWQGPFFRFAYTFAALLLGGALCIGSLRRYGFLLTRAECFGAQSTCTRCRAYGVLAVLEAGSARSGGWNARASDNSWVRVQCRRCAHEWRIDNG